MISVLRSFVIVISGSRRLRRVLLLPELTDCSNCICFTKCSDRWRDGKSEIHGSPNPPDVAPPCGRVPGGGPTDRGRGSAAVAAAASPERGPRPSPRRHRPSLIHEPAAGVPAGERR